MGPSSTIPQCGSRSSHSTRGIKDLHEKNKQTNPYHSNIQNRCCEAGPEKMGQSRHWPITSNESKWYCPCFHQRQQFREAKIICSHREAHDSPRSKLQPVLCSLAFQCLKVYKDKYFKCWGDCVIKMFSLKLCSDTTKPQERVMA